MGKKPQIAVLLANTGTPDDPSPEAVRRYLRDYLKDRRIVEMPPFIWLPGGGREYGCSLKHLRIPE